MFRMLFAAAIVSLGVTLVPALGQDKGLKRTVLKVDGEKREALVHMPANADKVAAPVVFVFHGHGGTMNDSVREWGIHELWPDAIGVYMQGLPTVTKSDPKGERPGWQPSDGANGNRDLKLFDEMLAHLKKQHMVDEKRVFACGFSNGGNFTYLLWAERGDVLTAVAPCGAVLGKKAKDLKPKPCLHIAGQKDDIVSFDGQQRTMDAVRSLNGCDADGQPWMKAGKRGIATILYPSKSGTPFVSAIHTGGHEVPEQAGRLAVRFFKEHPKK